MQDPTEGASRKLAAIMFTDIKDFSKKMAEDETRAFELLKMHDAIMRVLIAKFDGKVIKSLGDSFMVDFSSAVNAVKCAVEAQKRFWNFNRDKEEFERIEIRIGIHLGDVLVRDDDMIGDGVNVASRIEAVTEPSRICISQEVYQQIRNKIPIQVYELGPLTLKNIPEPVLVFEILIDSIPELAKPSQTAMNIAVKKEMEQATAAAASREAEELKEARRVEDARNRSERDQARQEEERRKRIEDHYARAEELAQRGKLEEAEAQLAEIYKLEPSMQVVHDQKRKEDESKEKQAQDHLARARAHMKEGRFDEAEAETNEVFRVFPLHPGAQQLILAIEEERYRQEELVRSKRAGREQQKERNESDVRISELLAKAHQELELEQFTDAIFTLRELFLIDPNHAGARRLEENIRQAEQAKIELNRLQQQEEEENQRRMELERLRQRLDQHRVKAAPAQIEEPKKFNIKLIAQVAAALLVVIALAVTGPRLYRMAFPKSSSISVLQFTTASADSVEADLQDGLPLLLADDFARCAHMSILSPGTTLLFDPSPGNLPKLGALLKTEYLLTGSVDRTGDKVVVGIRLFSSLDQQTVFSAKIEGPITSLHKIRAEIVRRVLDQMEVDGAYKASDPQTANAEAGIQYLHALHLTRTGSYSGTLRALPSLERVVALDPDFADAYSLSALAHIRLYEFRESDDDLAAAEDAVGRALSLQPNNTSARLARAQLRRYQQQFAQVVPDLEASLEIQPSNAECYRELSLISIVGGRLDDAERFAREAITLDPKNTRSHFALALTLQFRKDYTGAAAALAQTIALGSNDSVMTVRYLLNAWVDGGTRDRAIRYLEDLAAAAPQDYRICYWIGRAYQLDASVTNSQLWLEKGRNITRIIADAQPFDAYAFAYGGLLLTRLGRFPDAEVAMKRALELNPNSIELMYRRANMYAVQKENEKAIEALKQAIGRRFDFAEVLNPDFMILSREPEFPAVVYQDIGPRPVVK